LCSDSGVILGEDVVNQCLKLHSSQVESNWFTLSELQVSRTLGMRIIRLQENEEMEIENFSSTWSSELPVFSSLDLKDLVGHAFIKESNNRNLLQRLSIWELSPNPSERFKQLFTLRSRWPRNELEAYLR
jgi:hypothetical protein